MVHVEVEVEAQVVSQAVLEGLDVGSAPVEAFFLTAPRAEAEGALGRTGFVDNGAQLASDFHHAGGSRGVVHGALAVVDGVVVAANDDHFGGFSTNLTAGHVDGALLVVGDVDDHFEHPLRAGGVENGLLEDFSCIL